MKAKQSLAWFLSLLIVLSLLPTAVFAQTQKTFTDGETIGKTEITADTEWIIPKGVTVNAANQIIISSGTLTVNGGGTIVTQFDKNTSGVESSGVFRVEGGKLIFDGITLDGNSSNYANRGIRIVSGSAELNGGIIQNFSQTDHGAAIDVFENSTLTVNDVLITKNKTTGGTKQGGPGIYNMGTTVIKGGTITDNLSTGAGGGIYNGSNGKMTIDGGKIAGNTSTYKDSNGTVMGNNIFNSSNDSSNSILTIGGDAEIEDVYLDNTTGDKVLFVKSALKYPITISSMNLAERKILIESSEGYTLTHSDMALISSGNPGKYLGFEETTNKLFLTTSESEAYYPARIQSNDADLTVSLYQNGVEIARLVYNGTSHCYQGNLKPGTYDVYVDGEDTGKDIVITASESNTFDETYLVTKTADWLNVPENVLYVGGVLVTQSNAKNIITESTQGVTGTASFAVTNGVPTLTINGVTMEQGYADFTYGSSANYNKIYGIYFNPASSSPLKIKFNGINDISVQKIDSVDYTYGIYVDDNCSDLMIEGSENAKLSINADANTIRTQYCGVSINGGEYDLNTDTDGGHGSEPVYCYEWFKAENAKMNIVSKQDRGIWVSTYDKDGVTSIKNSDITIKAGTGTDICDGILSESKAGVIIDNSNVDIKCDRYGIYLREGKPITISGADTVVKIESVGSERGNSKYAAFFTEEDFMSMEGAGAPPITLNNGLTITTPESGSIAECNLNQLGRCRTVVDKNGNYARKVVIEAPVTHPICGDKNCKDHQDKLSHTAENNLNLVSGITGGKTITGDFYLSDDLTTNDDSTLYISGTVNLCLNGHTLTAYIVPKENAVLNICDCAGGGKIARNQGFIIVYQHDNIVVNMYGGTLETSENNTVRDKEDLSGVAFNLYGGTVSGSSYPAFGSDSLSLNLYGGKISAKGTNGLVGEGKTHINLKGDTEIEIESEYDDIKTYTAGIIDAAGYAGENISIFCSGLSEGDIVVKNVTDETAGKFTLSATQNSGYMLKRVGNNLVYTAVYTVSFDANGGSGTMAEVLREKGEYQLPECTFTAPEGKIFKAWSVDGVDYNEGDKINISKNTVIKAIWKNAEKLTVSVSETVQEFEYDGNGKTFTVSGNVSDGFSVKYKKDGAYVTSPVDAGEYDVIINRDEDEDYKALTDKTITGGLKINPKNISGASIGSFAPMTYNKNAQIPSAEVKAGVLTVTGSWSSVTNVYDKTKFTANGNFTGTTDELSTGMAKKTVDIPTVSAKNYNGNVQIADISDTEEYTVSENNGGTNKGRYDVKLALTDSRNYKWNGKEENVSEITLDFYIGTNVPSLEDPAAQNTVTYGAKLSDIELSQGWVWADENIIPTVQNNGYTAYYVPSDTTNYDWSVISGWNAAYNRVERTVAVTVAKAAKLAPESPNALAETIKGKADGKITGVDSTMEYKLYDADDYTPISGTEITNLAAGTYKVRYKESDNYFASDNKTVEIASGRMIEVTFNSNGGTDVSVKTCEYNGSVTAPEEPQKDGFEFVGWYEDEALSNPWDFSNTLTDNKTLYAKWVQGIISTDEGNLNGVKANGLNDVAKTEKTDIKLIVQVQEAAESNAEQTAIKGVSGAPSNFSFYNVSLEKTTGGSITDASSVIEIKLPYDLAGKTNIKVYRYHGGNAEELAALTQRDTVKPYEDGKCFVDVNNNCVYIYSSKFSTYSVAYDNVRSRPSGTGGVVSAPSYTVKFDTDGGSSIANQTVTQNGTVNKPADPAKDGYKFDGWYTGNDFAQEFDFNSKVTKNITIYAKWTENNENPDDTKPHNCPSEKFSDLDTNLWYHLDTDYVLSNGLMKGTSEKAFAPNENLTRAMLVTVLYRNEGEPAVNTSNSFTDVNKNAYYENAVSWAQQNGIVKGLSEISFAPDANITREQIAAIMHRYAKFKGMDVSVGESTNILSYSDFDKVSEYAIPSLQWAVGSGLIKGRTDSTLNPEDNATRAEIAAILHRFLESSK